MRGSVLNVTEILYLRIGKYRSSFFKSRSSFFKKSTEFPEKSTEFLTTGQYQQKK